MRIRHDRDASPITVGTCTLAGVLVGVAALACAKRAAAPGPHPAAGPSSGWTLDRQPAPSTLDEALETLERGLGPETSARLRVEEEDVAIRLVPTLGRWMQDHWGLETGGRLAQYFERLGLERPDDMAAVILTSLWRRLHFREIRLDEQIAWYRATRQPRE